MLTASSPLGEWLNQFEKSPHHSRIELGLARIHKALQRLQIKRPAQQVAVIAGTNGKGSCAIFLESLLLEHGFTTAVSLSPYLLQFNERLRLQGKPADDNLWCQSFERVYQAADDIELTYFELITLATLDICSHKNIDVAVLEVGMGGRLDAVNAVDADVAIITNIDIDHSFYLGNTREAIGFEKAGIMRQGAVTICGDPNPPQSLLNYAKRCGTQLKQLGKDFTVKNNHDSWEWHGYDADNNATHFTHLPQTKLPRESASSALAAFHYLHREINPQLVAEALQQAWIPGRFHRFSHNGIEIILDVAHNPAAAHWLAQQLQLLPPNHTIAIFGCMATKDADGMIDALKNQADLWITCAFSSSKCASTKQLNQLLHRAGQHLAATHESPLAAFKAALEMVQSGSRIVVTGSFHTVAPVLEFLITELR